MMNRPPLIARLLLRLLLPPRLHEDVAGDLEELWHAAKGTPRDRRRAFWQLTVRSIADCWTDRWRTLASARPMTRGADMSSILQDVRYAWRTMFTNPGFTAAAVLTLAVGVGATTAVFSIFNVVALEPLPYAHPDRVVFVLGTDTRTGDLRFNLRVADYLDLARSARSFEQIAAYSYSSANITGSDVPDRVQAYRLTANTFELLGVSPALGRTFSPQDAGPGSDRVAVLSDGLWRRRFGADPGVIGRTVTINGEPHVIIGVMPRRFEYPVFNFKGDLWTPWVLDPEAARANRQASGSATVVARMRDGVELESAASELQTLMTRLAADHPATNATVGARVIRMGRFDDEQAGPAIYVPLAAVGLVLLLACANVASLLLAKGISRGRELATRAALGANRSRILRQLLVESLVLAAAGAIAGIALAHLALDALRGALPDLIRTTVPNVEELGIDETTLTFAIGVMILTSLGFGMLPAWRASRQRSAGAVNEGARGTTTRATQRLRTALVVGEIALATVLVATAILVTRSYAAMTSVRPGFDADGILTMTASLAEDRYPTAERRQRFFEAVTERMATLPGVRSAAAVNVLPFSTYDRGTSFVIDGHGVPAPGHEPSAAFRVVTPGYFSTLGIPLVAGRSFESADRAGAAAVSIVNRTFTVRHFHGVDPVGRRIRLGDGPWLTIVGVVGDVHHSHVSQAPAPEVYVPLRQSGPPMMMFAIRTDGRVEHLVEPARAAVLQIDPLQPVFHVKPMTQLIADTLLPQQVMTALVGIFGIIALLLATIGIYGLVSYTVTQQMPEFGVRLALGATPGALARLVLRRCAVIVAAGTLLGTGAALLVSGALASALYGVEAADPSTYIVAAGGSSLLGLCAGIVPAWRSSGAEPLDALRRG